MNDNITDLSNFDVEIEHELYYRDYGESNFGCETRDETREETDILFE